MVLVIIPFFFIVFVSGCWSLAWPMNFPFYLFIQSSYFRLSVKSSTRQVYEWKKKPQPNVDRQTQMNSLWKKKEKKKREYRAEKMVDKKNKNQEKSWLRVRNHLDACQASPQRTLETLALFVYQKRRRFSSFLPDTLYYNLTLLYKSSSSFFSGSKKIKHTYTRTDCTHSTTVYARVVPRNII